MVAVAINRLRVRGPPDIATRAGFLIEDACRTELRDGERLILVRRLALGPDSVDRQPAMRAAAMRRAYEDATRDARHGGSNSAASANCVWFASRAEARRLLLHELLAGRLPHGWFWRLAVPEWRGQPAAQWLGQLLQMDKRNQDDGHALDVLITAVESGAADTVLEAVAIAVTGSEAPFSRIHPPDFDVARQSPQGQEPGLSRVQDAGKLLARIRGDNETPFLRKVEAIVHRIGVRSRTAALLLERLLIRASPSLALSNLLLHDLVQACADLLADPKSAPIPAAAPVSAKEEPVYAKSADMKLSRAEPLVRRQSSSPELPTGAPAVEPLEAPAPTIAPAGDAEPPQPSWAALSESASEAAGLWLVLPSLIRLGFREWLSERPELLAADAGRTMIRTIGAHHRVAVDDPALQPVILDERPFIPPDWALQWRIGLDRWLRRRAHISLARLIWKPGWIRFFEDKLIVRFALDSADIRLRRCALDVDPGWTDWLGLAVRYRYGERELH